MADDQWGYDDPFNRNKRYNPAESDQLGPRSGPPTSPGAPSGTPGGGGLPGGGGAPPSVGVFPSDTASFAADAAPYVTPAATTYLGMTTPQWLNAALGVYGAYRNSQPGTFQRIPEDPSQTAARNRLLGFVDHSPTRDMLGNLIGQRLGAAHPFELPQGTNGYNPNGGSGSSYDLSKILPALMMGNGGSTAPAATSTNPVAATADQWLSAHPEVLRMGVNVAAGAITQQFGIPQDQALQIVSAHLQGQRTPTLAGPAEVLP